MLSINRKVIEMIIAAALCLAAAPLSAQAVFINEIHYDNSGADSGEAIEVAGPAGTDLAGWSLVLYNGNGGAPYNTTVLAGMIPNQQAGFGTLSFAIAGIQNGSPDGIALVDSMSATVQFLSYEGSFMAVGGPANGLTSVDIGVAEASSAAVGDSLQLGGTGSVAADFAWQASMPETFGAVNTNQTFDDGGGGDSAPSVALTTPADGDGGVALDADITITFSEDVAVTGTWFDISCSMSGNHSAAASGGPTSFLLNPDIDFLTGELCTVTVFAAQVADVDSDDPPDNLAADYTFSFGTVTDAALVINEIDYDQPGTDAAEYVEIKNVGMDAIDLTGVELVLVNGNNGGAAVYATIPLPSASLAAGDYFVVCGNASNVINCDLDVSPDTNLVQNGAPDAVALVLSGSVIDAVSYEGSVPGYTEGSGAGLEDNSSGGTGGPNENKSISRMPDGMDTGMNNVDFQFVCSTPGAENTSDASDCPSIAPPNLLINEIDYDQPGGDTAEFIEIYNNGTGDATLAGVDLVLVNGNGGGATIYGTISLPAMSLGAGDYFVVCADALTVANCDLEALSSIQNGGPDAVALVFGGAIIDTVSYEGDTGAPYTEGSGAGLADSGSAGQDFRGISRVPNGSDTNMNNVDLSNACITPGLANTSLTEGCTALAPVLEIWQIQSAGPASPFENQGIRSENNVVTAVGPDQFAMQTPAARSDGDVNTSDGIVVFTGGTPFVAVGDLVTVTGEVVEFFDFTEFSTDAVVEIVAPGGGTLPEAVPFNLKRPSPKPMYPSCEIEYECYEGMLIKIGSGLVTAPNQRFNTDPIAEVFITAGPHRAFREPGVEFPGLSMPPIPTWDGNPEVFELDPDKLGLPNQIIPAGSRFKAVGILGYEFGGYEFWPSTLKVKPAALPVPVRTRHPNEFTVGTLNLFRLFDDVDDAPDGDRNDTVVSTEEYQRRLTKFSAYIRTVLDAPDILAVQEVESLSVLQTLASRINSDDASITYTAYLEEGNDIGTIDVGFLVRDSIAVDDVIQLGKDEILTFDGSLLNDRPPLLLEGRNVADGSDFPIAVISVHNRSLSGIDSSSDGPRVRQKRLEQAQFLAGEVQALQDADPHINLVVTGDFNAYEFTDGFVDVVGQISGQFVADESLLSGPDLVEPNLRNQVESLPPKQRYSFLFAGSAQVLDHALTSAGLDMSVRDIAYGRGNADAAVDLINDDSTPLRSSDHDGLVLYLHKGSNAYQAQKNRRARPDSPVR